MSLFSDKIIMLTGATGDLGSATAKAFIAKGGRLILPVRNFDRVRAVFPDIPENNYLAWETDLTKADAVKELVDHGIERFGRIDILVNTVGGYKGGFPVHETPIDTWDFLMDLNARTIFNTCSAVIPHMIANNYGKIINTAAQAGLKSRSKIGVYSASKSAVIRLTESMALELKSKNIKVNCILPGTIDTSQNRAAMPKADFSKWVKPESIADVILFLASDSANVVNGASIPCSG